MPESVRSAPSARDASLALCVSLGLFLVTPAFVPEHAPLWLHALVGEVGFVVSGVGIVVVRRLSLRESLSLGPVGVRAFLAAILGILALHVVLRAASPLIERLYQWMHLDFQEQLRGFEERVDGELMARPVATIASLTLLPALCEEVLFRGILLSGYARSVRPRFALLITSAIFGLIHVLPIRVFLTFLLGLYFGYVVLKTGSLWCGMAAHALNNALAIIPPETGVGDTLLAAPAAILLGVVLWVLSRTSRRSL